MRSRAFLVGGSSFLLVLLAASCIRPVVETDPSTTPLREVEARQPEGPFTRKRSVPAMGSELEITVLGKDPVLLERAITAAIAEVARVEDMMTDWRTSPLTRLNDAAGGAHEVPRELARLVARSLDIGRLTQGSFDITFAGVGKLWDFKTQPPVVPAESAIREALQVVDYRRVAVDLVANTVSLPPNFRIGLGGVAKGYAVDRAMKVLMESGIEHGIVNAGGDMKVLGKQLGKPWEVAVKHPRQRDHVIAVLRVSNSCVVTSGDYERFFVADGERYHHILDPRTGLPATGAMSATVIAPDAAFADALATALCVLGPQRGLEIIDQLDRVEALVVDMAGEAHASRGLKGLFPGAGRK